MVDNSFIFIGNFHINLCKIQLPILLDFAENYIKVSKKEENCLMRQWKNMMIQRFVNLLNSLFFMISQSDTKKNKK